MKGLVAAVCLLVIIGGPGVAAGAFTLGASYDFDGGCFGAVIGTTFDVSDTWHVRPDIGYYFDKDYWSANVNGVFALDPDWTSTWYGLAGVNITWASDDTDFGVNLGAGTNFKLASLPTFLEAKYVFAGRDGVYATLGVRF